LFAFSVVFELRSGRSVASYLCPYGKRYC